MVEYIMKKEICGTFHGKCGTRDLTKVFGTVPRKAGRVVTLSTRRLNPEEHHHYRHRRENLKSHKETNSIFHDWFLYLEPIPRARLA
jgi:hypothetical protein